MSRIKSMIFDIQADLADGIYSFGRIAEMYGVTIAYVELINQEMIDQLECEERGYYEDDGDALASAGFGMDEDYGCFDDYNYDYI